MIPAIILFCNYMMVQGIIVRSSFDVFSNFSCINCYIVCAFVTLQIMLYLIIRYLVEKYEMDRSAYASDAGRTV